MRPLVVLMILSALPSEVRAITSKQNSELLPQLAATGETEVLVMLREPVAAASRARRRAIVRQRRTVTATLGSDVRVHHLFQTVSGFTATINRNGLTRLLADPAVVRIDPMRFGSGALAQSVPQIRADGVHRRDDLGQGVTVAVLDTGVDPTHPDVAGSIIAEQCFCSGGCCPNKADSQSGPGSAHTSLDHGIHVTGIIVSQGIVAPEGVAPAAKVVAVKVLDETNRGSLADWIKALDWIAMERPDVQAINMSLVSDAVFAGKCDTADAFNIAFAQVLNGLRARGTLAFVSSGNTGEAGAMGAPACVSAAVAVGAVSKRDAIADFSDSDSVLDLLAPGVGIVSDGAGHSTAELTGTSMAAPHVTGTAALLLALNPALAADQLETVLESTGLALFDARNGLTFPRVDALAAMNAVLDMTGPLFGNGSQANDCLVEWQFTSPNFTTRAPIPGAVCRDNDSVCDTDSVTGQCTFSIALCFKTPDRRLPQCDAAASIVAYQLATPSTGTGSDATDAANAAAITGALPALPITETRCTNPVPFVVPVGSTAGAKWIRFSAHAGDGRTDYDRLRLSCLPAPS